MKVVSSNTETEVACHRAKDEVEWALRDLTANLIRVTRGAGRSHDIRRQMVLVLQAMQAHWDACGMWPSSYELDQMLSIRDDERLDRLNDRDIEWAFAEFKMVRGALQVAASTLLDQSTQRAAGHTELFDGLRQLERMREENRRAFDARPRAPTLPTPSGKSAKKPRS